MAAQNILKLKRYLYPEETTEILTNYKDKAMTEDAVGVNSILSDQLAEAGSVVSEANSAANLEGALYLNSNMTVDGSCLYTTADLAGSFPEGTVLQILPDSTILAVPPFKDASNPNFNNTSIIFKESSFINELEGPQSSSQVSNLLVESESQSGLHLPEVPLGSESNMSDIDLSFLNETVDSMSTSSSKTLTDAAMKELQGTLISQSLGDLGNDSSNAQVNHELVPPLTNTPKDSEDPTENVVMIDVSKPIQLSQNSLIMVNGQKCVLQQTQSGEVIAYPVKEQEKPRRRRGRPRKASIEQTSNDGSLNLEESLDPENVSDEEREHGLLQIVNDDGSLVRRSTRRRKKAKVLKDYETGNLKQELGSDVDDDDMIEVDPELSRKKKPKGPGRPRKNPIPESVVSGIKRNRGRPKKQVIENEPTQAFLVQTSDGQTLMMQVPLSSIPPGVSLQEVAQNIANRLNVGLHSQTTPTSETGDILHSDKSASNQNLASPTELAVQDHSVGSTTNMCNIEQFTNVECAENNADSSCHNISTDAEDVVVDSVSDSEVIEVTLKNVNKSDINDNQSGSFIPESVLQNQAQFSNLEMPQSPEERFSLNIQTSIPSSTNMSSTLSTMTNGISSKTEDQDLETNFNQFHIPRDFLIPGDFMKGKMSLQDLLENVNAESSETAEASCVKMDMTSNKENDPLNPQGFSLNNNCNDLKDFETDLATQIINSEKTEAKQCVVQEDSQLDKTEIIDNNYDFLTNDLSNSILGSNQQKDSEAIISSIKHDHNLLIQSAPIPESKEPCTKLNKSQFLKSKISAIKQAFQPILPLEKIASNLETTSDNSVFSVPTMSVVPVSSDQQLQLSEKILPIILPTQELPGSMKCKVCQKLYFTDEELIKHFKAEHPKCICKQCNYMSEYSYMMRRHSLRHVESGIVCEICGKHYKDHYILKMHVKMVHLPAEVVFTCEICDKKFTRKAHLKRHLRIHGPNRPYKCSFCSYRGCEKSDVTKHIVIHEAPKHACHICGKTFRHIKNKELHLKRHFKQRDYKCGICNFYGYTFTDIRKHIERRHTDAKSNTCFSCGNVFKNKDLLEEHKSNGHCKFSVDEGQSIKQELVEVKQEASVLEDMPLDLLESEHTEEPNPAVNNCSETLQSGQLIMNSAEGILGNHNGQLVVNSLEGSDFLSENLPFLNVGNESNKLITLVTNDGKNYTLPLKDSSSTSETVDCTLITDNSNKVENLFLAALRGDENT